MPFGPRSPLTPPRVLGPEDLRRTERIDAMVGGAGLGLDLAEELERLAPFGMGNPGVRLLVPAARVRDVRTMGQEGKHARFSLHSGAHRALGVAFGRSNLGVGEEDAVDAAVRLEVNRWNGSVEPRVVLRELYPVRARLRVPGRASGGGGSSASCDCRSTRRPRAMATESAGREVVRGGGSVAATVAELVSSGAEALVVCADAVALAWAGRSGSLRPRAPQGVCGRCGGSSLAGSRAPGGRRLHGARAVAEPRRRVRPRRPRRSARLGPAGVAGQSPGRRLERGGRSPGYLHEAWDERRRIGCARRARGAAGQAAGADRRSSGTCARPARRAARSCSQALRGSGAHPRGPEAAARCFRVLAELELVRGAPDAGAGTVGVVSSEETELERSAAFRAYGARHQEALRYLERRKQP